MPEIEETFPQIVESMPVGETLKAHDEEPMEQGGELQEKPPQTEARTNRKRTKGQIKEVFKAQCLKKAKFSGLASQDKKPSNKGK